MFDRPAWKVYDPFMEDFRWPSLFTEQTEWMPPFDVSETDDEMIVRLEVPGMDKKDININLSHGTLTVTGEKKQEKEETLTVTGEKKQEKEEKETYHCTERCYGTFSRSISLPFEVDGDKVDASFKDGVLKIVLPRSEAVKPKKIEVH
jgi:HSP20 family protein